MMTRREAHCILECMKIDLTWTLPGTKEPMLDVLRQRLDAINVAQAALRPVSRERVEKMWRGDWIDAYPGTSSCKCTKCGTVQGHETPFCCYCGAPMTDEAVEMVMERMEVIWGE